MRFLLTTILILLAGSFASAEPSQGLTKEEITRLVEVIGPSATGRLMRSAEPYPSMPGVKMGFEVPLFFGKDLNELGDGSGSIPGINFAPRFFIAKGLFYDLEAIVSFIPAGMLPTPATFSAIVKYSFSTEEDSDFSAAFYAGYTKIEGFGQAFRGKNFEFGGLASKDYVTVKPYMGVGIVLAKGEVARNFAATDETQGSVNVLHFFGGIEWEGEWNVTAQLDFMNSSPMLSLALAKRF